jgi:hypothetical protein
VGLMLGVKGLYFSGPQMANRLDKIGIDDVYFLLAEDIPTIPTDKGLVMEYRESFEDDRDVQKFVSTVPRNGVLVLGLSSPKQNVLAIYLHSQRPDIEYFCLGAAVKQTWGFTHANTKLRGTGLQWLEFLLLQPRRTGAKLAKTLLEALKVVSSSRRLKLFRRFICATKHDGELSLAAGSSTNRTRIS